MGGKGEEEDEERPYCLALSCVLTLGLEFVREYGALLWLCLRLCVTGTDRAFRPRQIARPHAEISSSPLFTFQLFLMVLQLQTMPLP